MIGLTSEQVRDRMRRGQVNQTEDYSAKSTKDIIRENVCTYFNLIFAILAVLCIAAGSFNSLTFLTVVLANTGIGIAQEIYAKSVLDKLSIMNQPEIAAVRDGKRKRIPVEHLVLSDVVYLQAGKQIPADARVVQGQIYVNEALLTGEADEIQKQAGDELMSGSFVVSGACYAELIRVGDDSYISKLMAKAKKMKKGEDSEMIRSINRLIIASGIMIIPVGIALFYQGHFVNGYSFAETVPSMVAALIGMIPEGMYLLVSVALAMSAALLARKKVMLHDMKSTETLARVDVLCVDKTGTITDNSMLVAEVVGMRKKLSKEEEEASEEKIRKYLDLSPDNNQTMEALRRHYPSAGREKGDHVIPFSSKYKYGCVTIGEDQFILGAPECVLAESYDTYKEELESYAAKGNRVVVFAKYTGENSLKTGRPLTKQDTVELWFAILLQNPLRENAKETFSYFGQQGVEVKVISGDHALTVSEVAKKAGIAHAEKYIDASTLRSDAELAEAAGTYTVFGRTTPEQKQKLIKAMKKTGKKVAMTGDGVNDILAMKSADCSIAMAAGSDAAAQAAQVVLLDSDFSHMPQIVAEGRKTVNNIKRSSTLFLVKNIFSFLLAVFSIISTMTYPLQPSQITLISMFNIGIPAFFLAMEPNYDKIEGRFFSSVLLQAMPAALTNFFVIAAMVVFGNTFNVSATDISVASTFLMAIIGFMIVFKLSEPLKKFEWAVLIGCMTGFLFCAYYFRNLFSISSVSVECIMLFVLFAVATEPCMRYLTRLFEYIAAHTISRDKSAKR